MRNLQEQVKKAFCYQKLFWPFTIWINSSSDLKNVANSWPSTSNFKSFSRSLEQFFLTVGQNNFGNKIPLLTSVGFKPRTLTLSDFRCSKNMRALFNKWLPSIFFANFTAAKDEKYFKSQAWNLVVRVSPTQTTTFWQEKNQP